MLTVTGLGLTSCSTGDDKPVTAQPPSGPALVAGIQDAPLVAAPQPQPSLPSRRVGLDASTACVHFSRAAATVDAATSTLGLSRQLAARAYGTPQLQALYEGARQGRDPEQDLWRQHRARVTATAVPAPADEDLDDPSTAGGTQRPGTVVAVLVTGTAQGDGHWSRPVAPYRVDCLTVQNPVAGWLVDDVAVSTLVPAAG